MSGTRIRWQGEELTLLAERALFRESGRLLVVSDLHLGKSGVFRSAGLAVPEGANADDLARLDAVVERTAAARLAILGDLFHARSGVDAALVEALGRWRRRHAELEITLVRGNHDRHAGDPPTELGFRCVDAPHAEDGWTLVHFPPEVAPGSPTLAGHLHPVVRLRDGEIGGLRVPCFHVGPEVLVLPAFGSFTGGASVRAATGDRLFAVGPSAVVELPYEAARGQRRGSAASPARSRGRQSKPPRMPS